MFKSDEDIKELFSTNFIPSKSVEHPEVKSLNDIREIKNNVNGLME